MLERHCGNCVFWDKDMPEPGICKKCGGGCSENTQKRRRYFYPVKMDCGICGSEMIFNRSKKFYWCDICGNESWPYTNEPRDEDTIRQEFEKTLPCDRSPERSSGTMKVSSKLNGGSKTKSNKSKKQLLQKPSTTQLYNGLSVSGKTAIKGDRHDKIL